MKLTNKECNDGWIWRSEMWKSIADSYHTIRDHAERGTNVPVGPEIFCNSNELVDRKDPKKGYK